MKKPGKLRVTRWKDARGNGGRSWKVGWGGGDFRRDGPCIEEDNGNKQWHIRRHQWTNQWGTWVERGDLPRKFVRDPRKR